MKTNFNLKKTIFPQISSVLVHTFPLLNDDYMLYKPLYKPLYISILIHNLVAF